MVFENNFIHLQQDLWRMKKYYYYITVFLFTLFSLAASAQESKSGISAGKEPIEGLNIYPNPVSGGKLYITSKSGQSRDIEIFDVLGKRILAASISGKRTKHFRPYTGRLHHKSKRR
jgi:hypothetical protein